MKKFFKEFKDFISRGNVMDMAVGVIVGGAFSAIVTALTGNILMPIINWVLLAITGGNGLDAIVTFLPNGKVTDALGEIVWESSIYINWGAFITAIINFILIALVLFFIIKAINNVSKMAKNVKKAADDEKRKKIAEYKKSGLTGEEAEAKYAEEVKAAEELKAKQEAEKAAAEEEAKKHTTEALLEDIKALLEKQVK